MKRHEPDPIAAEDVESDDSPFPTISHASIEPVRPKSVDFDPYPRPGERFNGFVLMSELGRGAMGRVFLARQPSMASRTVVLKIGEHLSAECERLAKLQHPNIVPVHSFHQGDWLQAVCMPYRGPVTLAHVVSRLQHCDLAKIDGKIFTKVVESCRQEREPSIQEPAATEPVEIGSGRPPLVSVNLRRLSFVEAVLKIIRQIVEGLRSAHAEGIVHCDLKPANVLIGNDGVPQLIDFGIALDEAKRGINEFSSGGTRAYMSPEQLRTFLTRNLEHDHRTDLYAVGVMLYELLTGRVPFDREILLTATAIEHERQLRFSPLPSARAINRLVPPAVEAIIGKCLAPEVSDRYHSAADLLEDLDRQLARRPLKFAPNPSRRELMTKWGTRNRIVLVLVGMASLGSVLAWTLADRDDRQREQIQLLETFALGERFAEELREAEFLLGMSSNHSDYRAKAWSVARRALDCFGAWDDSLWFERPEFRHLPADRLSTYREQASGLMLLLGNDLIERAMQSFERTVRDELLSQAEQWNRRVEITLPEGMSSRTVWMQRGQSARIRGDAENAERWMLQAASLPSSGFDAVLEGRQLLSEGRVERALKRFSEAMEADPQNFWASFHASNCQRMLGKDAEAVRGYDLCHALVPGFYGTHLNRGQVLGRLRRWADAEQEFIAVVQARPEWPEGYFQLGLAHEALKNYAVAIDDLNRALQFGYSPTSVYLVRSRVYGRLGDKAAAEQDFARAMREIPTDERSWLARAQARILRDRPAALADFEEVLKRNPRSIPALQGKAHLLSKEGKSDAAIEPLTRIIEINPDSADAWSGRGVLHARLKHRDLALTDAKEALRLSPHPRTRYQVAGIYALTSTIQPEDRREAFSLLDSALRDGFGFEHLKDDRELDPLRADPEFAGTVERARAYWDSRKKR